MFLTTQKHRYFALGTLFFLQRKSRNREQERGERRMEWVCSNMKDAVHLIEVFYYLDAHCRCIQIQENLFRWLLLLYLVFKLYDLIFNHVNIIAYRTQLLKGNLRARLKNRKAYKTKTWDVGGHMLFWGERLSPCTSPVTFCSSSLPFIQKPLVLSTPAVVKASYYTHVSNPNNF